MQHAYEPLNTARSEFVERRSQKDFLDRFNTWKQLATASEAGSRLAIAAYYWHTLPDEAAEALANAIMKAIADMEEQVVGVVSTKSKRPPADLTERIRKAQARADAQLATDGMEMPA